MYMMITSVELHTFIPVLVDIIPISVAIMIIPVSVTIAPGIPVSVTISHIIVGDHYTVIPVSVTITCHTSFTYYITQSHQFETVTWSNQFE